MAYRALTESDAVQYAYSIPDLFPSNAKLTAKEIGDGNLNLVFHVKDRVSDQSVIFKQALPYARVVGESWPLTLDRARIEKEALVLQRELCPDFVPQVYHYDAELALTVMEDLSDHVILRKGLIERNRYPLFGQHIGTFLAKTLFYQSDFYLSPAEKKKRVAQFINIELCKITEDLVFTDPYGDAETNSFNSLIREEAEKLWKHVDLKKEIACLKHKFLTATETLIHGDLHTGSVFVTDSSTKVIDPEFAFYGPMGFDIGAVIANLVLNFAAQEGHIENPEARGEYQAYLLDTIDTVWSTFEEHFTSLTLEQSQERSLKQSEFVHSFVKQVKIDSLGYAGCKTLRRVIGLASVADLESIPSPEVRANSERLALRLGEELVLKRTEWSNAKISEQIRATHQAWEEDGHDTTDSIRTVG